MTTDIGIDFGSYKTVLFSSNKIVLEMPSIVTVDSETFEPVYFGKKAEATLGRTPETLSCVRPVENGVISDMDLARRMLSVYIQKAFGKKIVRPRIMASIPPGVTEMQHHSLSTVIEESGGRNVSVIESPIAVAMGLGIDLASPRGRMIIDIGAGTTDIAVISMGGIASCATIKSASFDFDDAIIRHVRREYNIMIGPLTAENIKKKVGCVIKRPMELACVARGRDILTGLPQSIEVNSSGVLDAVSETASAICTGIKSVLEKTDPDLVADITEDGVYLAGGGSLIYGMSDYISDYLQVKVNHINNPAYAVVRGTAAVLKNPEMLSESDFENRAIRELIVD